MVPSHIATDEEMLAQIQDLSFVCEGRIGDRRGSATYEQHINAGAVQAQYDWPKGVPVGFSVVYDAATGLLQFTIGGQTLAFYPAVPFTEIYLRTYAVTDHASIILDDLVLNGAAVGDISSAVASCGGGLDILWIRGFADPASAGFTLTGHSTMYWNGAAPAHSHLAYELIFDDASRVPSPASIALATIATAIVAFVRRLSPA